MSHKLSSYLYTVYHGAHTHTQRHIHTQTNTETQRDTDNTDYIAHTHTEMCSRLDLGAVGRRVRRVSGQGVGREEKAIGE